MLGDGFRAKHDENTSRIAYYVQDMLTRVLFCLGEDTATDASI